MCCVFVVSDSGSAVSQNCSYIQSPGGGASTTAAVQSSYTYTIDRIGDGTNVGFFEFIYYITHPA